MSRSHFQTKQKERTQIPPLNDAIRYYSLYIPCAKPHEHHIDIRPGFCMCRIVTMCLRLAWASHPRNVRLGIAANIFVQAGTVLLYVTNLVFAQRIIRAQHPRLGWHRGLTILSKLLIAVILLILILLIFSAIHGSYTLDPGTRADDRAIQLMGTTFYTAVAFLPIPMLVLGLIVPRRIRTEKFGSGRFRYKIAILASAAALCTIRAGYGCGVNWLPPTPLRPGVPIRWQYSKPAFYVFNFVPEIIVVVLYAIVRVDRRFYVPSGVRGSYIAAPSALGDGNLFENGIYPQQMQTDDEVLKVYSEEELFDDSATLADTLRYSRTSLCLDSVSGKWALKRMSAASLYSRDGETGASMSGGPSTWSYV